MERGITHSERYIESLLKGEDPVFLSTLKPLANAVVWC